MAVNNNRGGAKVGNEIIPLGKGQQQLDQILQMEGLNAMLNEMKNPFSEMGLSLEGWNNTNHYGLSNELMNRLRDEYQLTEETTPDDFLRWLQLREQAKKAGIQTEDEKKQQKMQDVLKGVKTGADIGSALADKLPGSYTTLASPARGWGMVGRK